MSSTIMEDLGGHKIMINNYGDQLKHIDATKLDAETNRRTKVRQFTFASVWFASNHFEARGL